MNPTELIMIMQRDHDIARHLFLARASAAVVLFFVIGATLALLAAHDFILYAVLAGAALFFAGVCIFNYSRAGRIRERTCATCGSDKTELSAYGHEYFSCMKCNFGNTRCQ